MQEKAIFNNQNLKCHFAINNHYLHPNFTFNINPEFEMELIILNCN
nr:MAG TPA: hypothetical protein [Caudoviricetes sp.]